MKTVTINDAARMKGVSRQAIRAAIRSGKLQVITVEMPHTRVVFTSLKKYEPNPRMKRTGRATSGGKNSNPRKDT